MSHLRPSPRGQAMVEYLVVCAALAAILFLPLVDAASAEPKSTIELLIEALQTAYQRISYALSVPT